MSIEKVREYSGFTGWVDVTKLKEPVQE